MPDEPGTISTICSEGGYVRDRVARPASHSVSARTSRQAEPMIRVTTAPRLTCPPLLYAPFLRCDPKASCRIVGCDAGDVYQGQITREVTFCQEELQQRLAP